MQSFVKSAGIQAASLVALRNWSLCPDLGNVNPCSDIYQASYLLSLLFDGLAVMLYQFLIGFNTTNHSWFFGLSLPITALCTLAAILFAFCLRKNFFCLFNESALFFRGSRSAVRRYRAAYPPVSFTSAAADLVGGRLLRLRRYCNLADHDSLPCKAQERSTKAHAFLSLFLLFCIIKKNVLGTFSRTRRGAFIIVWKRSSIR